MATAVQVDADKQSAIVTGTSIAITAPTNLADDDVLYACISRDNSDSSDAITVPSGWTLLAGSEVDNDTFTCGIYRRVIVTASGEPSSYTWSWTSSEKCGGWIVRVTGANTATPEDVTPSSNTGTGLAPRCSGVTTVTADTLLLACVGMSAKQPNNYTAPSGMTEFFDFATTGGGSAAVHASLGAAEENRAATGATGDRDFASIDNNAYVAFLIAVRPAEDDGSVSGPGSPSAAAATASGAGVTENFGSGSPTAVTATTDGAGATENSGVGSPVAVTATTTGAGVNKNSGVGTPTAITAMASGAGATENSGAGTPIAVTATTTGAGVGKNSGSGSPQAQIATTSAVGEIVGGDLFGSGLPQAQLATTSAAGINTNLAAGLPVAVTAEITAAGINTNAGSGSPQAVIATISAAGVNTNFCSGSPQAVVAIANGAGILIGGPGMVLRGIPGGFFSIANCVKDPDFLLEMRNEAESEAVWCKWDVGVNLPTLPLPKGTANMTLNVALIEIEANGNRGWARSAPGCTVTSGLQLNMQLALLANFVLT